MGLKQASGACHRKALMAASQGLVLVAIDGGRQGEGNGSGDRQCLTGD